MEAMALFSLITLNRLVLSAVRLQSEMNSSQTTQLHYPAYLYKSSILKQRLCIWVWYKYNLFRISKPYYILITFINMQYAMFRWAAPDAVLCAVLYGIQNYIIRQKSRAEYQTIMYTTKESFVYLYNTYEWDISFYECVSRAAYVRRMHLLKIFSS